MILLLNSVVVASSVSDNDENAFITKSEFENMRNKFNEELNRYYSNIDDKIDEAIALYLSGFSLKDEEELKIFDTSIEEVEMYDVNNPQWVATRGNLSWEIYTQDSRYSMSSSSYVGSYIAHCFPIPATNGTYAFIDSEKFTDSYAPSVAEWKGVSNEVKDTLMLYGGYKNASYRYGSGWGTNLQRYPVTSKLGNFRNLTNVNWLNGYAIEHSPIAPFEFNLGTNPTDKGGNIVSLNINGGNLQTTYGKLKYKNMFVPYSSEIKRLRHISQQRWWLNDAEWNNNTTVKFSDVFADFTVATRYVTDYYKTDNEAKLIIQTMINLGDSSTNENAWPLPYVGFVNNIDNTNKLYMSKYDGMVSIINKYYTLPTPIFLHTNEDDSYHFPMWAGYPLAAVRKEEKYRYTINFKDNEEYYLALKNSPFNDMKFIDEDSDLLPFTGGTEVTGKNYRIVKNGDEIKWETTDDGYIFIKWSKKSNGDTCSGGGTFVPQQTYYHIIDRDKSYTN